MLSNTKIVVSGRSIEVLHSKVPVQYGFIATGRKRVIQTDPAKIKENRIRNLAHAVRRITRSVEKNDYHWSKILGEHYNPALVTNTFRKNIQDLDVANREFTLYMQRFNYSLGYKNGNRLKYTGAIEFQKRGAIHYHTIIFNLPYVPKLYDRLRSIWKLGSINHQSIKGMTGMSRYITKYITKNIDDDRLAGRKTYFSSRGLEKPRTYRNPENTNGILLFLQDKHKVFESVLGNKYLGEVEYLKYLLPYDDYLLQKIN